MKNTWGLFFLFILIFFISCAGTKMAGNGGQSVSIVADEFPGKIESLLEQGEHLRALALIDRRRREGHAVDTYYKRALEGLKTEWAAARSDGDWQRSLTYLRSFKVLEEHLPGEQKPEDITELGLYIQGVEAFLGSGKSGAAALLVQSGVDIDQLSPEICAQWAERFQETGHVSLAERLRKKDGAGRNADAPDSASIEEIIDGTVTVWVNRGIRLVGNVGVPDRGIGSGFFIDPEGYILTNYHVIESEVDPSYQGYSRLYIKKNEDSPDRIPAKVVGYDKDFDLALLKTEMEVPYVFSFAGSDVPSLGEKISAIGSPGGLARTLTTGTVSAFARSVQPMAGSLQIDVPINPGNSGGPLLNDKGEVIGVVFAGVESYEGVNFAIPGTYVKQLVPALYGGGETELPWMGISAWDSFGRLEVVYVVPGSPAHDAGLKPGDILKSVDGKPYNTIRSLQEYLITRHTGTLCSLVWERETDGKESFRTVEGILSLGVRPDIPLQTALTRDARENLLTPLFGFQLERISGSGVTQNYRVADVLPGSIADESGFTPGDTFALRRWIHDEDYNVVAIQMILKGRKAGFLEAAIQIAAYLDVNSIL